MKKLLILIAEEQSAAILEGAWSWPVREWNAKIGLTGFSASPDDCLRHQVLEHRPDVVCYVGINGGPLCPSIETFRWVRDRARLVHLCTDAAVPSWWPLLTEYKKQGVFDLTIATDGVENKLVDEVYVWPVDPWHYREELPRDIRLSWAGSYAETGPRRDLLDALGSAVTIQRRLFPPIRPYAEFARFLLRSQATIVHGSMAPHEGGMHVKGRVMEAARAGCCLFEQKGSPVSRWFETGLDYFEYDSPQDIVEYLKFGMFDQLVWQTGGRMKKKAEQYTPQKFWDMVAGD